jgi:hypothetical protein
MDATDLQTALREFLGAAVTGDFGDPSPGEWDAAHILAHVAAANLSIASTALAVAAGQRPANDNRATIDGWYLARAIARVETTADLVERVVRSTELLCSVAEQLDPDDLDVLVPTLIVSNDQTVLDQPIPLRSLIAGIGEIHLPRHADQLRSLIRCPAPAPA